MICKSDYDRPSQQTLPNSCVSKFLNKYPNPPFPKQLSSVPQPLPTYSITELTTVYHT